MMRIRSIFTKMGISVLNKQNLTLKKIICPIFKLPEIKQKDILFGREIELKDRN